MRRLRLAGVLLVCVGGVVSGCRSVRSDDAAGSFDLFAAGAPGAVIVPDYPEGADARLREGIDRAVALLNRTVEQAAGFPLPVAASFGEAPAGLRPVFVGGGPSARAAGHQADALEAEAYRVAVHRDAVYVYGRDVEREPVHPDLFPWRPATYYAVARMARDLFGAVWLWPGELGYHVPSRDRLSLPAGGVSGRPFADRRSFSIPGVLRAWPRDGRTEGVRSTAREEWERIRAETGEWLRFYEIGARRNLNTPHSFAHWWERHHAQEPDLFALPPPGQAQPFPQAGRVKLRLGNPAVADRILEEWVAADMPDEWGVGPNDGSGFCTAPETRALDDDPNLDAMEIWRGTANLTPRYVRFWNALLPRFRERNPNIRLLGLVYSAYREPPPPGMTLEPGMVFGFVHTFHDDGYAAWEGWSRSGMGLILRPNWWHMGAAAPHMNHRRTGDFFRWAATRGMEGFHFDSLLGYWGTQGLNYLTIAELSVDPDRSVDDIEERFLSAFGAAAPSIRAYIEYWTAYTRLAAYPVPAGGITGVDPEGLYMRAVGEHALPPHPLVGSHRVLPFLYGDPVLAPARRFLDLAEHLAAAEPDAVRRRVAFLRDGLDHLVLNREAVALGMRVRTEPELRPAYEAAMRALLERRRELSLRHVIWGDVANQVDRRRGSPSLDGSVVLGDRDLDGI